MSDPITTTHFRKVPSAGAWSAIPAEPAKADETSAVKAEAVRTSAEHEQLRRKATTSLKHLSGTLLEIRRFSEQVENTTNLFGTAIPWLHVEAARIKAEADAKVEAKAEAEASEAASIASLQAILGQSEIDLIFDSHFDFYDRIIAELERLKAGWLDPFGEVLSDYVAFFDSLTKAMSGLADAIKGTDSDGNLIVDYDAVRKALGELIGGIHGMQDIPLGRPVDTREEAERLLEEMGSPPGVIINEVDGKFQIQLHHSLVQELINVFPEGEQKMSPAAHAALDAAKNAQMERLMHINRVIPDRYQRQVQSWETLVKILTGTIQSTSDTDSRIVQAWS